MMIETAQAKENDRYLWGMIGLGAVYPIWPACGKKRRRYSVIILRKTRLSALRLARKGEFAAKTDAFNLKAPNLEKAVEKAQKLGTLKAKIQSGNDDFVSLLDSVSHPFAFIKRKKGI